MHAARGSGQPPKSGEGYGRPPRSRVRGHAQPLLGGTRPRLSASQPVATPTAVDVKFSDAISSRPRTCSRGRDGAGEMSGGGGIGDRKRVAPPPRRPTWRPFSLRMSAATSGSTSASAPSYCGFVTPAGSGSQAPAVCGCARRRARGPAAPPGRSRPGARRGRMRAACGPPHTQPSTAAAAATGAAQGPWSRTRRASGDGGAHADGRAARCARAAHGAAQGLALQLHPRRALRVEWMLLGTWGGARVRAHVHDTKRLAMHDVSEQTNENG